MNGVQNHWNKIYSTKQLNETSWTGVITIETFRYCGPTKFSGLEIKQYSQEQLTTELQNGFEEIQCVTEDHTIPFNMTQNFLFS